MFIPLGQRAHGRVRRVKGGGGRERGGGNSSEDTTPFAVSPTSTLRPTPEEPPIGLEESEKKRKKTITEGKKKGTPHLVCVIARGKGRKRTKGREKKEGIPWNNCFFSLQSCIPFARSRPMSEKTRKAKKWEKKGKGKRTALLPKNSTRR